MKDHLIRTVVQEGLLPVEDKMPKLKFAVTRTRDSKGFCSIRVEIHEREALRFNTGNCGDSYEQCCREVAEAMLKIADNDCLLPRFDKIGQK